MAGSKQIRWLVVALVLNGIATAQQSKGVVRHHKVPVEDPSQPPELTQAEVAIQKKDYASAEPLLKKVVATDPANYVAWFDLGFVYNALGNSADSIASYRKSVAAKPDVFESNLNLGLMLAKERQPDAEQFLSAATTLRPTAHVEEGRARAWLSLAHVLEVSKPGEAITAYSQAASLQPKDIEPRLAAGRLLEQQNRFADAEAEYKKALAIDPASGDALTGLANIYMRGHMFAQAKETLQHLVALRPNDAGTHLQLGRMLAAAGDNDGAVSEIQAALKIAPGDLAAQRDLADLSVATKKYEVAEAQYKTLLASNPKDAELHHGLGKALLEQRKFPEAQQEFINAVTLKPDFGAAYGDLATAASENKNYPLAIKAIDDRDKLLPPKAIGYFLRASAYDHLRQYKLAAENYHRFLETDNGEHPDQEWQATHRLITIEPKK